MTKILAKSKVVGVNPLMTWHGMTPDKYKGVSDYDLGKKHCCGNIMFPINVSLYATPPGNIKAS